MVRLCCSCYRSPNGRSIKYLVVDDNHSWLVLPISSRDAGLGRGNLKVMNWLVHLLVGAGYGVVSIACRSAHPGDEDLNSRSQS